MTALAHERDGLRDAGTRASGTRSAWPLACQVGAAVMGALGLAAPAARLVWHGGFADPDDALRLAQVRAWLAGQSWFDVTALRLDPPHGASMHWSRLVDVPNAVLIEVFGLVCPLPLAETLDRLVLPCLWLVALLLGMGRIASLLFGAKARGAALFGTILCSATMAQVQPGRIGHHAPSTVVLVWTVVAMLEALDPRRARWAAAAGLLVALGLTISLETLPFLAALCLAPALAWVGRGAPLASTLSRFGGALAGGFVGLFVLTVPPARWLVPAADALGPGHVGLGVIGGVGAMLLSAAGGRLRSPASRLAAAAALGVVLLLFVLLAAPELVRGPFAGIDPLVRAVWLDQVVESKSLVMIGGTAPMLALALALPVVFGLLALAAAAIVEVRRHAGATRVARFTLLAGLVLVGLGLGAWQVRAFASVEPLALFGGLVVVAALRRRPVIRASRPLEWATAVAILPFTALGWAVALPVDPAPGAAHACLAPEALAPLAALPAGRVVAPLETGSHLVATTALDPFAGPYHRNNDGNRFTLDVWAAPPAEAERLLSSRGVRYVLTCAGEGDMDRMARRAPGGLAARLLAGDGPAFLTPVPLSTPTPYRIYTMGEPSVGHLRIR